MGFAVRANRDNVASAKGSRKQNLVLLRPVRPVSDEPLSTKPTRVTAPAKVKQLPRGRRLPFGLRLLVGVQQGSTVVTGGLVATALVVYSWTVYLDKTITRSFQHLETLKVSTQQVTTANETLKHSMAQQAELPTAGLVPVEPERVIFLSPAPARSSIETVVESELSSPLPHPLGY